MLPEKVPPNFMNPPGKDHNIIKLQKIKSFDNKYEEKTIFLEDLTFCWKIGPRIKFQTWRG